MEGQRKNIFKISIEKENLFSRERQFEWEWNYLQKLEFTVFFKWWKKKNYQTRILIYEILFNEENSIHLRLKQQQEFAAKRANQMND